VASIAFLCWRWRCDTDRSALHASSPLRLGVGALATVTAAGWAYLLLGAGIEMDMGGGQKMVTPSAWSTPYAALISIMWWVMMVAMMLPTAAPTVLLVTTLAWDRVPNPNLVPTAAMPFASGLSYRLVRLQPRRHFAAMEARKRRTVIRDDALGNGILTSTVFVAAGLYQWTPLKDACLRHCRSPTEFLTRHWRPGSLGAVGMGVRHGLFCLGCCWLFITLLFVGGLMNLAWVGAIALFVLMEKTMPWADWMSRLGGALLVVWGVVNLASWVI
jgi:predicted metal-binding membrane protein